MSIYTVLTKAIETALYLWNTLDHNIECILVQKKFMVPDRCIYSAT